jgi:recombination protein RecA
LRSRNHFFRVFRNRFSIRVGGYPRGESLKYTVQNLLENNLDTSRLPKLKKAGGIAAFIDAEHAFDRNYAEN